MGWLIACFGFQKMVKEVLQAKRRKRLDLFLYDLSNSSQPRILYSPFALPNTTLVSKLNGTVNSKLNLSNPIIEYQLGCSDGRGPPVPWLALEWGIAIIVITLLVAQLMRSAGRRIMKIENAYRIMKNLRDHTLDAKLAAEQADNSKSKSTPQNSTFDQLQRSTVKVLTFLPHSIFLLYISSFPLLSPIHYPCFPLISSSFVPSFVFLCPLPHFP